MFKAMTLNINYYGDKHGPWSARLPLIAQAIRDAEPDVVALQAVAQDKRIYDGQDQATQLAARLPGYDAVVFEPAMRDAAGRAKGSAFISRHPISAGHLALSRRAGLADTDPRIILGAGLDLPQGPLQIFNAHFSWVYQQAQDNFRETLPYIGAWPGRALLMGDLNTTPEKELIRGFKREGWLDTWPALRPHDPGYTFEADAPGMRIDYIFANRQLARRLSRIEIVAAGEASARFSDHLGIMLTLV